MIASILGLNDTVLVLLFGGLLVVYLLLLGGSPNDR